VRVFHGSEDEEVSPRRCAAFVEKSRGQSGDIRIHIYRDATHGFDDPSAKRQQVAANAVAATRAIRRATRFFARRLGTGLNE
jgi:carboxymethylenebutenolidase